MVSPLSATRYHRPHPYEDRTNEDRTPIFSPRSTNNSSNYSNTYDIDWRPNQSHNHNNYSQFEYNSDSYRCNYQTDRYFDDAPIANNYCRSPHASTSEKQQYPSSHEFDYLNKNSKYQDFNPLADRNKWSKSSRTRLHEAYYSHSHSQVHQEVSISCTEDTNKTKPNKWQNHLRESQFSDHDKDYVYDSHYGYVAKVHSTEIVSEKDSNKTSKIPKRSYILNCLICSEEVERQDIHGHLLFGFVQCIFCPWSAENCKDFSKRHKNKYQCSHSKLRWIFSAVKEIGKNLKGKAKQSLKDYLASTIALKHYAPHDFAYNHFQTIVDEMPDEDSEEIPSLFSSDLKQNQCPDPSPNAGIYGLVNINGNVTALCNNSEEAANTVLQNLEEFITFNTSSQHHVLQDESASEEMNVELLSSNEIFDSVSKTYAKKEYLESSSSSRMPKKKKKTQRIVSVRDKHQTLIIGAPSDDINETKKSEVTPKKEEKECHSEDRDILPSFVSDNYVLTYALSDDCPQCYAALNPLEFTVCMKSHIIVAKCGECSLNICFRNKLIDSYKLSLKKL